MVRYVEILKREWRWLIIFGLSVGFIGFIHLWQIDSLPRGLYVDESSIGLNAIDIGTNLHDEHGKLLPVYFEAFGEYKNPIYIYTAAILFKLLGISVWTLRLTSALYFFVFLAGLSALTARMFPKNRWALLFTLVAGGTLPWLFTLSRISFEVISQPAIWVWALYGVYRTYHSHPVNDRFAWPFATGLLAGLSVYAYSTGRLLSFGLVATVLVVYHHRSYWKRHAWLLAGAGVGFLPYIWFALTNPGALTARLSVISYLYDPGLSLWQKTLTFVWDFSSYVSPAFLLLTGDGNTRHNVGVSGELYVVVFGLAVLGVIAVLRHKLQGYGQFTLLLMLNLCGAAVAAALTESGHSLRSVLMGIYFLIFAVFGFSYLENTKETYWRRFYISLSFALLILEASSYLAAYFGPYANKTETAFESYNFPAVLQEAVNQNPQQVIISSHGNQPYAPLEFYRHTISNPMNIPLLIAEPVASSSSCIIYFISDPTIYDAEEHSTNFIDQQHYSQLRCFGEDASR